MDPLYIKERPVGSLTPYKRNARTHSKKQIKQIAASIKTFGFTNPILIDKAGIIIAGHGRLRAAQLLGMETVPTICLDHLNEQQTRALVIADNKLAELAGWDEDLLKAELQSIAGMSEEMDLDFDLSVIGFDNGELERMLQTETEGATGDDNVPSTAEKRCQAGDLWQLGKHRLLCGDATNAEDVARLLDGQKVDLVYTDPPYGMGLVPVKNYASKKEGKTREEYEPIIGDDVPFDAGALMEMIDCKHWYIWGADYFFSSIPNYADGSLIVWAKRMTEEESIKVFGSSFEICWTLPRTKKVLWFERAINQSSEALGLHPTQKPTSLAIRAFEKSTKRGALIVDLYVGSGTTIIAAEKLDRRCYAMEISPEYCDVVVQRWEKFTEGKAYLVEEEMSDVAE